MTSNGRDRRPHELQMIREPATGSTITVLRRSCGSIYNLVIPRCSCVHIPKEITARTMLRPRDALVCGLLVWGAAPPSAATAVALGETGSDGRAAQDGRKLTGRFLHITGGFVGFYWGANRGWELTARCRFPPRPVLQDVLEHLC